MPWERPRRLRGLQRSLHSEFMMAYEAAKDDLNEGKGCIRALVGDTAAATSALSCGTNDRDSNELKHLQEALRVARRAATTSSLSRRMSVNEAEAVKTEGQEKAEVKEEMSVMKVKAKTEGVKEKEFKESDERGEKVLAMKGGAVAKVTVPSMKFKG